MPCELKNSKFSMKPIRSKVIKTRTNKEIRTCAIKALKRRYKDRFELFLKERGKKTHFSEISTLTKKEISIC